MKSPKSTFNLFAHAISVRHLNGHTVKFIGCTQLCNDGIAVVAATRKKY